MNHSTSTPLNLPGFVTCQESVSDNPCTERSRSRCRTGSCWGDEAYQTISGEWLCPRALEEQLVECSYTTNPDGTPIRLHPDQMVEYLPGQYCQAGYYAENIVPCNGHLTPPLSCSNYVDRSNPSTFFNYDTPAEGISQMFCAECLSERFFICPETQNTTHMYDSIMHEGINYSEEGYRLIQDRIVEPEPVSTFTTLDHSYNGGILLPSAVARRAADSSIPQANQNSAYLGRGSTNCDDRLIHGYHHRPNLHYYGGQRPSVDLGHTNEPFMGWELETCINNTRECEDPWHNGYSCDRGAYHVYNCSEFGENLMHCEHDGSISGFEIVSHPGTFRFWKENPDIIKNVCQLRHHGYTSHNGNRAGHHIHISSNAIEEEQFFKMQLMMYNPAWKDFWYGISQRTESHANTYARMDMSISEIKARTKAVRGLVRDGNKQYLLNSNTSGYRNFNRMMAIIGAGRSIEFRLFRGTLLPERFFKNLEVVQSMWMFTKEHNFGKCMDLRWWIDYISNNTGEYENLDTYIREQPYREFSLTPYEDPENLRMFNNWLYPEATPRRRNFPMLHVPYLDPEFMADLETAA